MRAAAACQPRKFLCYYERTPKVFRCIAQLLRLKRVTIGDVVSWIDAFSQTPGGGKSVRSSDQAPHEPTISDSTARRARAGPGSARSCVPRAAAGSAAARSCTSGANASISNAQDRAEAEVVGSGG